MLVYKSVTVVLLTYIKYTFKPLVIRMQLWLIGVCCKSVACTRYRKGAVHTVILIITRRTSIHES